MGYFTPSQLRNIRIPRPSEMREKFQPAAGVSTPLLLAWSLSALLTVIIPVSKWANERNKYYTYYGKYNEYENQQRQYEEQQNGNNNNRNYLWNCSWWDFKCRMRQAKYQQMYGNGEGGGQEQAQMRAMLPDWYFFFGGTVEEDERRREEMGSSNEGSMKFVYFCIVLMFLGVAAYGFKSMYSGADRMGVIVALLVFGMFSLLNLLTTVQGTVETDNRFFEDSVYGWYGQWSVLVAYTDFWMFLFCFIYASLLGMMNCLDKKAAKAEAVEDTAVDESAAGYNLESA